jgi:hypothetical protein
LSKKRVPQWVDESSLFFAQVETVVKKARFGTDTTTNGTTSTGTTSSAPPSLARAPSLMRTASRLKAKEPNREVNTECNACEESEGQLLVCDSCPNVYHMECLDPPLSRIPTDWWYCPIWYVSPLIASLAP